MAVATIVVIVAVALLPLLTPWFMHPALDGCPVGGLAPRHASDQAHVLSDETVTELALGPGAFAFAGPDGGPFYDAAERAHMQDARTLLLLLFAAAAASAVGIAVALKRRDRAATLRAISTGGGVTAIGVVIIGVIGLVAFEPLFELFHRVFFPGGNWAFDPRTEHLVQLYPYAFWEIAAAAPGCAGAAAGVTDVVAGAAPGGSRRMIVGSVLGLRVRVHPSWLVVIVIVIGSLVAWMGGSGPDQLGLLPSLLVAIVVAALFFASVLIHELAHALVARRRGVDVAEVSLFIVGGASGMGGEPTDASSEGLIALAGPLLSGIVGVGLLLLASVMPQPGGDLERGAFWMVLVAGRGQRAAGPVQPHPGLSDGRRPAGAGHRLEGDRRPGQGHPYRQPGRAHPGLRHDLHRLPAGARGHGHGRAVAGPHRLVPEPRRHAAATTRCGWSDWSATCASPTRWSATWPWSARA